MRAVIFSRKKKKKDRLIKRKKGFIIFDVDVLPNSISLVDGLCYEIIESSNLQFFLIRLKMLIICNEGKNMKVKKSKKTKKKRYDSYIM